MYADVAPAVPLSPQVRQVYTYRLPTPLTEPYAPVRIPFGSRRVRGVIMRLHDTSPRYALKSLTLIPGNPLTEKQIAFAHWIAKVTHGGLGFTLRLFLPPVQKDQSSAQAASRGPAAVSKKMRQRRQAAKKPVAVVEAQFERRWRIIATYIQESQQQGRQTVILVPEKLFLKPVADMVRKVTESVQIFHAGLSSRRTQAVWEEVYQGRCSVIVGTQKALFLPYRDLGCVVIEEEQFPTHKLWDQYPRLHNGVAAPELARLHQARLVYASSFPSLSLQYRLQQRKEISLKRSHPIKPKTHVIPLPSFKPGSRSALLPVMRIVQSWLRSKKRVLLLMTRTGAKKTEISAQLQALSPSLQKLLVFGGTGIFRRFPPSLTPQFDRILWLYPEYNLGYPDFRTEEHAQILLARLQSLLPSHQPVWLATRYPNLIEPTLVVSAHVSGARLLRERSRLHYPPYNDMVRLTVSAATPPRTVKLAQQIRNTLQARIVNSSPPLKIFGPYREKSLSASEDALHLLLLGPLAKLQPLYSDLKSITADIWPNRVV